MNDVVKRFVKLPDDFVHWQFGTGLPGPPIRQDEIDDFI
jgi:hypothetical protein